jgi:uncharacterized RDD family membrane protein YckC
LRFPVSAEASGVLPTARVLRRFGAMLYDALLVVALLMVVTAAFLPLTGGEALTPDRLGAFELVYRLLLLFVIVVFFGWFWTHRGQTLGMAAWRLRVQKLDGSAIGWSDALKRMAAAVVAWLPLGLGYFWIWIDRDQLAWPDRWTGTRVVVLPKKKR